VRPSQPLKLSGTRVIEKYVNMRILQKTTNAVTEEEGGVGTQTLDEELVSTPDTLFIMEAPTLPFSP
jgi:hypothetical protein